MTTIIRSPAQDEQIVFAEGRLSADVWAAMPETTPHYELIDGVLQRKMPTRRRHNNKIAMLIFLMMSWGYEKGWRFNGEGTGLRIDDYNGFVPDFVGFAPGTALDGDAIYDGPPFLIAEVLSPATAANDREIKMRGYARAKIEIYLVVDPTARKFEVYRLNGEAYGEPEILTANEVWQPAEFAGLQLELAKLWM